MPIIDVRDDFNGGSGDMAGRVPDGVARPEYTWTKIEANTNQPPTATATLYEMGSYVEYPEPAALNCAYIVGRTRSPNCRVRANMQFVGFGTSFALLARCTDMNNRYTFSLTREGQRSLSKTVGGAGTVLDQEFVGAGDVTALMELRVKGARITALLNDVIVFEEADPSPLMQQGGGGVRAGHAAVESGAVVRVFDFEVIDLTNPIRAAA